MVKLWWPIIVCFMILGCSSDSSKNDGTTVSQLNPCATKGATYLVHYTELSGNCGPLQDEIYNTPSSGTTNTPIVCDEVSQDGCTARDTNCRQKLSNGCMVVMTFETTFTQDGSSADGIATINLNCPDGSWCQSTYKYTYTRQ
jgi:hypothetical protein